MAVLRKDNIDDSCICVLSSYSSHAGDRLFLSLFGGVGWPSGLPCPPSPTVHPVRSATLPRRALQGPGVTGASLTPSPPLPARSPAPCVMQFGETAWHCQKPPWVSWRRGAFRKLAPESEGKAVPQGAQGGGTVPPSPAPHCSRLRASFIS